MDPPEPVRRGHSVRATRALQKLAEADPAFAALALWVDHRDAEGDAPQEARLEGDGEAAAWTDGRTVFYGPAFDAHDLDRQMGLAAHQILHVALRHPARDAALRTRLGPRHDPRLFNIAADALINETLLRAGYVLPRPCLTLGPLLARALGDRTPAATALASWDAEALTLALIEARTGRRGGSDGAGDGGGDRGAASGQTDRAEAAMREAAEAGFAPDIDAREDGAGGEADAAEADAEWRQRFARALEEGRLAGRGLGAMGFRIADLPRSEVRWERHLRALAARALLDEPRAAWSRPSRRWTAMDGAARAEGRPVPVFEPGRARGRPVPRLAVGVDASSSVGNMRLAMFMGQVAGIARRAAADLHLIVFDDAVRSAARVPPHGAEAWLAREPLARGGGTSFDALFEAADRLSPALLIVLTDLDAPVPSPPPGLPLLWAVPARPSRPPAHGRVIDLSA